MSSAGWNDPNTKLSKPSSGDSLFPRGYEKLVTHFSKRVLNQPGFANVLTRRCPYDSIDDPCRGIEANLEMCQMGLKDPTLRELRFKLVPRTVSEDVFWRRYVNALYHIQREMEDERNAKRAALKVDPLKIDKDAIWGLVGSFLAKEWGDDEFKFNPSSSELRTEVVEVNPESNDALIRTSFYPISKAQSLLTESKSRILRVWDWVVLNVETQEVSWAQSEASHESSARTPTTGQIMRMWTLSSPKLP